MVGSVIDFVPEIYTQLHIKLSTHNKHGKHGARHLIRGIVVDGVPEIFADGNVDFEAGERPRDEDDLTVLRVEGKVLHIERAVRLDQSRVHPQDASVGRHDCICHHVLIELLTSTDTESNS